MGHFGRRRTVTAAGGASSNARQGIALRIRPEPAAPFAAFFELFFATKKAAQTYTQTKEPPTQTQTGTRADLFSSRSPMFVAARAAHAKLWIRDVAENRVRRARPGRLVGRERLLGQWRDGCRTDSRVCTAYAENQRYETVRRATARASSAAPSQQAGFRGDGKPRNQRGRRFACPTREPGEAAS